MWARARALQDILRFTHVMCFKTSTNGRAHGAAFLSCRLLNTWQPAIYCHVHEVMSFVEGSFDALPISVVEHICTYKFELSKEDVGTVLRFLHKVGLALYYEDMIKDWIFLNPAFITRRIANVIKEGHKGQQTRRNHAIKSELDPLWSRLHQDGFLDMKLLNFLWSDGYEEHVPRAVIVKLLCHFGVFVDVSNGVGGEDLLGANSYKGHLSEAKRRHLSKIVPAVHMDSFLQMIRDSAEGTRTTQTICTVNNSNQPTTRARVPHYQR